MSFRIRLWPSVFTVIGLAILISLGTWQLNQYVTATAFEEARDATMNLPVVVVESPDELVDGDLDFHPIKIKGSWDDSRLFLLKHRVYQGDPGFWVVNAFLLDESSDTESEPTALLVNRGWIPFEDGVERAERLLEEIPEGTHTVEGLVHHLDEVVVDDDFRAALADNASPTGVLTLDTYDLTAINDALPFLTYQRPIVLTQLDDGADGAYPIQSYDHITDPYLTAETHFGYMLTWYLMAVALIGIWIAGGFGLLNSPAYTGRPDRDTETPRR